MALSHDADQRASLLDRAASGAAEVWTIAYFAELKREGRRVEGGWPGTVREARSRAAQEGARVLVQRSLTSLTGEELDRMARIICEEAKVVWRNETKRRGRRRRVEG